MIRGLSKILRALSVLFISLSVLTITAPLSDYLGRHTVAGVHSTGVSWFATIFCAIVFASIGVVLFCYYLFSRRKKRGLFINSFLWGVVLASCAFGTFVIFEIFSAIVQH